MSKAVTEMNLVLPMAPSANRYWRNYRGVTVVSEEARAYKKAVAALARMQHAQPLTGNIEIRVDVYRGRKSGDLDNRLKVTLDSLRGIAYGDDSQITEIVARRLDDKADPRIEVRIVAAIDI